MPAKRFSLSFALTLILLLSNHKQGVCQDISWMKGLWKMESGNPYLLPAVSCINTLEITAVADSTFNGIQSTFFEKDTAVRISYNCVGLLTKEQFNFHRTNLHYKMDSNQPGEKWNNCAECSARTCSLYVNQNRVLLLLTSKDCDSACNGTIIYYRELNTFDTVVQQQLVNLYKRQSYTGIYTSYNVPAPHNNTAAKQEQDNTSTVNSTPHDPNLPPVLRERTSRLEQTLTITSTNIDVILLDDAEIDGDIISLYDNNVEVLSHKMIGKEVVKYSFKADKLHAYHELVLVAENLGSIPPNTALMRIRAGDKKYELTTRANMHENAKVIIEYEGD